MLNKILSSVFGTSNSREVKRYQKAVEKINALESGMQALSDNELAAKTNEFKERLKKGEMLTALLPESFAVCREASLRVLGMRHFDVQLIGGMVLHEGKIAEMGTGEGKTLVATLAVYLNALTEEGVHVVTVNDYLAKRDSEWMGTLYKFLGMSVGVILSGQMWKNKYRQYNADITYGTNNEFGFDYLRDNMAFSADDRMQRKFAFAIVDEVDSILIDEARTPLIISGPSEGNVEIYSKLNGIPSLLKKQLGEVDKDGVPSNDYQVGDYILDEKNRSVTLTEDGHEKIEKYLNNKGLLKDGENLYDARNINIMQNINAAIRAHALYERDKDYIIETNEEGVKEVVIIDEFTGRKMQGRRWSDGLHQAIEAKENVPVQNENQTLASITFQNYFRLYGKLAGMTGTADTESVEFQQIYNLPVVVIPSNQPIKRADHSDLIYLNEEEKFLALAKHVGEINTSGQPVLIGTASIDSSEKLSAALDRAKIQHEVLNAKNHEREASIIAQAGRKGSVTIATNMAGRGTDIVLGGNVDFEIEQIDIDEIEKISGLREQAKTNQQEVISLGGLHVIGTERHESRRVDNQLRGRSGRQGDPGSSIFYLSLEDDLMRIFASERMRGMMEKLGLKDGESIEHNWVNKAIANAQKKVEGRNFEVRKQLLEYDNVVNEQRKVIYQQRNDIMSQDDWKDYVVNLRNEDVEATIADYIPPKSIADLWDIPALEEILREEYNVKLPLQQWLDEDDLLAEEGLRERILENIDTAHQEKEQLVGAEVIRHFEKAVLLQVLDNLWKEHLGGLDYLRQGIHLRGYAQRNPVQEYKKEAFEMFEELLDNFRHDVTKVLCFVQLRDEGDVEAMDEQRRQNDASALGSLQKDLPETMRRPQPASKQDYQNNQQSNPSPEPIKRDEKKIGRNEPCPCGSGKKYKHCHGKI